MSAPRKELQCAYCGATFFGDKRHKYCSEICAAEAHRKQARERYSVRYATMREEECARRRKHYRENKEKEIARSTAYLKEHPGRYREYKHDWYCAHKEAIKNA